MNITLLQIDLVLGARILLSLLREKGYNAKSLQVNVRYTDSLTEDDLEIIWNYVSGSDVVGLSFNTFYATHAEKLACFLRKKGIRYIIAGGNHATALPEEVMRYSDVVVKYEAEITLVRVLESLNDYEKLSLISGIAFKHNDKVNYNNTPPEIVWKLDELPFQCVDIEYIKFFDKKNKLYTPEKGNLFPHTKDCYFILASRGCPFTCTYCSNSLYHLISSKYKKVRKRSVFNIIEEMEYALENGYKSFYITDDNFFSFDINDLRIFGEEYLKRIKMPFSVVGINPNNFRQSSAEEKLKILLESGLTDVRIGIQSGSDKTLKVFKRNYKSEEVPELLAPLDRNRKTIWEPPYDNLHIALDFICDGVWETNDDKKDTIKLALKALKQYSIFFYTLVYLPGTQIYNEAVKNNWIDNNEDDIYFRGIAGVDDNIFNRILFLIAVTKERSITLSEKLIDHILEVARLDIDMAKELINSIIDCINSVEEHHSVNLEHAALHPYLKGFNEWTKTTGQVGRKVLFRSYHEPYG
jgi:radical SAM superfamily enzyme YgiQ (UPF0313 family)